MKKPDTYVFPAVFTYEDGYDIAITFPDLPGCTSSAKDERQALTRAKEALGGHLWTMEDYNDAIPDPTALPSVELDPNERAQLIEVYMPAVRLAEVNRSVNRTVTLPAWLNAAALEKGVNFSQVLQSALMDQLNITRPHG